MTREGGRVEATLELLHEGEALVVQSADVVVGRTAKCTVRVVHPLVSREHCRLELRRDGLFVTDLGSVNGTWIDGVRVEGRTRLRAGARLGLGHDGAVLAVRRAVVDGEDVTRSVRQEDLKTLVAGDPRAARAVARVEVDEDAAAAPDEPDLIPTRSLGDASRPSSSAALLAPPESIPVVSAIRTEELAAPSEAPQDEPTSPPAPAPREAPPRGFAPGLVVGLALGLAAVAALARFTHALDAVRARAAEVRPR